ncbi:uncharacterized protein LOC134853981 isoform X2 [Symsagittifera roscoffensis]
MTAAEIIFSELDRPEYKSGKSDLFVPWGHRKREPTIKPTALKWRSLSSQLIVQKSYSSLLGGAKQNSNGDDDASASSGASDEEGRIRLESASDLSRRGSAALACKNLSASMDHINIRNFKQSRRSAPFAIKRRSIVNQLGGGFLVASNHLEVIQQSPERSSGSGDEGSSCDRSPVIGLRSGGTLENSNTVLNASLGSLEEHHDRSLNAERHESDENIGYTDIGYDSFHNATVHHFPDSFDIEDQPDEGHVTEYRGVSRLAEQNKESDVANGSPTVSVFSRQDVLRRSFPLCNKKRFVLGDMKTHLKLQRNASSKNSKNAQTDQKSCKSERKRSRMNKSHFLATQRGNTCIAIWDHVTCEQDELQFRCGDVIEILDQSNRNWWLGKMFTRDDLGDQTRNETKNAGQSEHGWFPSIFVQDLNETCRSVQQDENMNTIRKYHRRALCVRELLSSERSYVNSLKNVLEIYQDSFKHSKSIKIDEVNRIFCNMEEIFEFHKRLLVNLEKCAVDPSRRETRLHEWCVSEVFIGSIAEFVEIYSTYCNQYQSAISTLKQVQRKKSVDCLIENCRRRHGETLSLQHFLLTPIQKICRYQMQLTELVNNTQEDHPDYSELKLATEEMRRAAFEINERRRAYEAAAISATSSRSR